MSTEDFVKLIEGRIYPFTLRENGRAQLSSLFRQFPETLLLECVDIGIKQYFRYDKDGNLTTDSVSEFLNKLGGIAYNKSRSPIEQELGYIRNYCNSHYSYWDNECGSEILERYVHALKTSQWSDQQILEDLQTEVKRVCTTSRNWSQWNRRMEQWITDIENWNQEDYSTINEKGTVLPTQLFDNIPQNIQVLCKQINASYESNLYDCTAIIMRRLLEGLLVLAYQNNDIENEITEKSGWHYTLDKIIKNAIQNKTLSLSANSKQDMSLFKDIGNYAAHKIWYNSTRQDIEPHIFKYRVIIEELMYKAGIK